MTQYKLDNLLYSFQSIQQSRPGHLLFPWGLTVLAEISSFL